MSERTDVQNPMLKYAGHVGWDYLDPTEALRMRGGDTGLFCTETLEAQLLRLNPGVVDVARAGEIVRQLRLLKPSIDGNRNALNWLRGDGSIFVPEEKRERNVWLIDFANPDANKFQVTDEWQVKGAVFRNRADVVFLINGIPVAVAETKAAEKTDGVEEGIQQIRRYHLETPELFVASQVFEVTHLLKFFYGATWSTSRKNFFNWKDVEPGNYEKKVKVFFERRRFLQLLRDYIVFLKKDDVLSKIILRQHQSRAVEKVIERVQDPARRRGLIWHTQGSGKTLTMITIAAKLLREAPGAEKPTVLILVDRTELEANIFKDIAAAGLRNVKIAQNKMDLQDILRSDYRGPILSMIHKFDNVPADINTRRGVVILVDEAHRSTGGDLGNYLMGALPNATYIGFTGTPIDNLSRGKGTFKVFGADDPAGYLDKYSIAESIEDGTTLRLHYSLAPSDLRVDRETLDKQFLELKEAEGMSDQEELTAVLDRAVELCEMMKTPGRMAKIAELVAHHFKESVEPMGFKAFLVAVDREACALYKKQLDKHLPPEWSRVIYSPSGNDGPTLKEFWMSEEEEREIRKAFVRKQDQPKILIVTEKLLTGYDAPILYCMYLDKPMRDHVLLQAVARVNRPYEDDEGLKKPCGFVVDFVGIFEKLEKALAFDSDVVTSVIQNVDVLKKLFATWMHEKAPPYLPLTRGWDDKAKEKAIENFAAKETREEFFEFFRNLQNLYDILSPDAYLRPFMDDYQALAELYALIRNAYSDKPYVDKEFTAKTRELLRTFTASGKLEVPGAIHELGPKELAALKDDHDTTDRAKVLNLRKILTKTVNDQGGAKPFLVSIGERAEALAMLYEDRQLTTKQALLEFEKLGEEYVEADKQRQQLGVDENTFALYIGLKSLAPNLTAAEATNLNAVFFKFPDYLWDEQQKAGLRTELYKKLRPMVGPSNLIDAANALLRLKRI